MSTIKRKVFYTMSNIGKAKYVINHHDGEQTHPDGSPFFGITICKNKKKLKEETDKLTKEGYKELKSFYSFLMGS